MALKIDFENLRTLGYTQHGAGSERWLGGRRCGISPSSITQVVWASASPFISLGPVFFSMVNGGN